MAAVMHPESPLPRFSMNGIRKSFGATVALDGVDFSVDAGEVHALVGENGAGKSTLMKILSGALKPDAGTMSIDGKPYQPRDALEGRRAGVAMIYQELSLASHLTVGENIVLGMEPTAHGVIKKKVVRARAIDALDRLGHPDIWPQVLVSSLSVGARQIVEIARSLATGCRVLVLDEPTSSLTLKDIQRLFSVIETLKREGNAIVYISHFLEEVKQVADRFTVLRDGRTVDSGRSANYTTGDIVTMMVGRKIEQLYPRSKRTPGDPVLTVKELNGSPKPIDVNFDLRRGEILGIAGLVGAGRTELLRTIFGLSPVKSGEVRLGLYAGPASPALRWMQGAGLLSEDRSGEGLALSMSITDNIMMNLGTGTGPMGLIWPRAQHRKTEEWVRQLDIRCQRPTQRVRALSGGNQQKVAIARLLHQDVDVVLLDEPTRGIDVASKSHIYALMDRLATGDRTVGLRPKAILVVSSYLPELLGICDRIAVMHRGHLSKPKPAQECTEHSVMLEATGQGMQA
jgi:ribose transport system ATP-binding protein